MKNNTMKILELLEKQSDMMIELQEYLVDIIDTQNALENLCCEMSRNTVDMMGKKETLKTLREELAECIEQLKHTEDNKTKENLERSIAWLKNDILKIEEENDG